MADGTLIKVRNGSSIKRRSTEDETHVEADGNIFKWTEYAKAHMVGDGIEMTRRTAERIATIATQFNWPKALQRTRANDRFRNFHTIRFQKLRSLKAVRTALIISFTERGTNVS